MLGSARKIKPISIEEKYPKLVITAPESQKATILSPERGPLEKNVTYRSYTGLDSRIST